jgi:hypothetical protein
MKNAVFWDVAPCRACVNRRFGETYHHHLEGTKIRRLQPPAHAGSSLAGGTYRNITILSLEAGRFNADFVKIDFTPPPKWTLFFVGIQRAF